MMPEDKQERPEWQHAPAELVQRFAELIAPLPGIEPRKMFGYPSAFFGGHLFAGLFRQRMFVRLPAEQRAELLALEGAAPFAPMEGRPMKEYVLLPPEVVEDAAAATHWLERSLAYAALLPPKEAKPKRKGSR